MHFELCQRKLDKAIRPSDRVFHNLLDSKSVAHRTLFSKKRRQVLLVLLLFKLEFKEKNMPRILWASKSEKSSSVLQRKGIIYLASNLLKKPANCFANGKHTPLFNIFFFDPKREYVVVFKSNIPFEKFNKPKDVNKFHI